MEEDTNWRIHQEVSEWNKSTPKPPSLEHTLSPDLSMFLPKPKIKKTMSKSISSIQNVIFFFFFFAFCIKQKIILLDYTIAGGCGSWRRRLRLSNRQENHGDDDEDGENLRWKFQGRHSFSLSPVIIPARESLFFFSCWNLTRNQEKNADWWKNRGSLTFC